MNAMNVTSLSSKQLAILITMNYKILKDTYTYKNENGIFLKKNLKK